MKHFWKPVVTAIVLSFSLFSCTKEELPEPPKKKPTQKMRQWNDYVAPNGNGVNQSNVEYTYK